MKNLLYLLFALPLLFSCGNSEVIDLIEREEQNEKIKEQKRKNYEKSIKDSKKNYQKTIDKEQAEAIEKFERNNPNCSADDILNFKREYIKKRKKEEKKNIDYPKGMVGGSSSFMS